MEFVSTQPPNHTLAAALGPLSFSRNNALTLACSIAAALCPLVCLAAVLGPLAYLAAVLRPLACLAAALGPHYVGLT